MKRLGALTAALLLASCGDPEAARQERVHDMMGAVMQPGAESIWDRAGYIVTEEGEESLFPKTDAEWQDVADAAEEMAELGRRLQTADYAPDQDAWLDYSKGVVLASEQIEAAVAERDEGALFNAGGILYNACVGCHQTYVPDIVDNTT